MSLTGAESRKYLADLEVKKTTDGNAANDPAGVVQRKLKRKDINAKPDIGVGDTTMDIDNVDAAGDVVTTPQADSPQPKKMKTGKGADTGGKRPTSVRGGKDTRASSTALNAQVLESFWNSDFDFRRYANWFECSLVVKIFSFVYCLEFLFLVGIWRSKFP